MALQVYMVVDNFDPLVHIVVHNDSSKRQIAFWRKFFKIETCIHNLRNTIAVTIGFSHFIFRIVLRSNKQKIIR